MIKKGGSIPFSVSLEGFYNKVRSGRKAPVNKRVVYLGLQAIFNGLVIGVIAKGLVYLIDFITNISFYGKFSFVSSGPSGNHLGIAVIIIPVIGGIIVGVMARYGSRAITGHGIPEAMEKIILEDSRIPPIITFLKPLSAAISIGTGGPFGAEGPIIATGGAFGSFTGQWMHISSSERKIILAAGACSGMATIFGTPLAAILLAVELLLFEFSARSIIPVALGCLTGAGMHLLLFGNGPVFAMAAVPNTTNTGLIIYIIFGLLIGLIAASVSKSVYLVEDLFEKLPVNWMWWPAIGAIAIGVIGYIAPITMGVGYENIKYLVHGTWSINLLLILGVLKYLSWVISLGSGTSGGTLAPLFTIGGAIGSLLGVTALHIFPHLPINLPTIAILGMAAMFAGASRALLTSIVFALETTGQNNTLLPLIASCIVAYMISFFLMKGSIMTEKIHRRGVKTPDHYQPDALHGIPVIEHLSPLFEGYELLPFIYKDDDMELAAVLMGKVKSEFILVLDTKKNKKPLGILSSATVLNIYSEQKQKEMYYNSPAATKRLMVRGRKIIPGRWNNR